MKKVNNLRLVLLWGVGLAIFRAAIGMGLGKWAEYNPEADMLALSDAPTMAIYVALSLLGFEVEIVNASDQRFLAVGITVWFFLGLLCGVFVSWYRKRAE